MDQAKTGPLQAIILIFAAKCFAYYGPLDDIKTMKPSPSSMDMDNRKMDPRRTPFIDVTNLTNGKNHDGLRHEECAFQILDVSPRLSGTHKDPASSPSAMPAQKVILIDLTTSPNASDLGNRHDVDESQHGSLLEGQMQSHCAVPSSERITTNDSVTITPPDKKPRRRILSSKQIEAKRVRERARYANMSPAQREDRRARQRVQKAQKRRTLREEQIEAKRERQMVNNMTPQQRQVIKDREYARRIKRRNTIHPDSITMINPNWNGVD
ncbi:hypothetical protein EJB05_46934, partial [Eragrostis curvula]